MKSTQNTLDKINSFRSRKPKIKEFFEKKFKDENVSYYNSVYGENISENVEMGKISGKSLAIYWGNRSCYRVTIFKNADNELIHPNDIIIGESGASLIYTQLPDGRIVVQLYKAITDPYQAENGYYVLKEITNPQRLSEKTLNQHWHDLVACMDSSAMLGKKSKSSSFRMFIIQITKKHLQNGTIDHSWLTKKVIWLFTVVIPILFSGAGMSLFLSYCSSQEQTKQYEAQMDAYKKGFISLNDANSKLNTLIDHLSNEIELTDSIYSYKKRHDMKKDSLFHEHNQMIEKRLNQRRPSNQSNNAKNKSISSQNIP